MKSGVFAFFVLMLAFSACVAPAQNKSTAAGACLENGKCIDIRIADSAQEREQGLMFEKSLPESGGMLFVFENEGPHAFWMKNTLIPLDIVWLDTEGKIVFMRENALPCREEPCETFSPDANAKFVLETNAGFAEKNGLEKGWKISISVD